MSEPSTFKTEHGREIAYHHTPGNGPTVVFLGGFKSDMDGSKAVALEAWAKARGQAFLRFDYSGHGQSSGAFTDGCIGDWADDAEAALRTLTLGKLVLVGSSMGGWISCLMSKRMPERIAGFVGIAAAPDFTEAMWAEFTDEQRAEITRDGVTYRPSEYGDPYPITEKLIEDGRANRVMTGPLPMPWHVRLLQGTQDADVPTSVALGLLDHIESFDVQLLLKQGADHRFSTPQCLGIIERAVEEILAAHHA